MIATAIFLLIWKWKINYYLIICIFCKKNIKYIALIYIIYKNFKNKNENKWEECYEKNEYYGPINFFKKDIKRIKIKNIIPFYIFSLINSLISKIQIIITFDFLILKLLKFKIKPKFEKKKNNNSFFYRNT